MSGSLEPAGAVEVVNSLNVTTFVLGIGLAAMILWLVRRDRLSLSHGVFWMCVALIAAVLGTWPRLIDRLAATLGISYPPALLLLLAIILLFIKGLMSDIEKTRLERRLRRVNQRLALYESERTHDAR